MTSRNTWRFLIVIPVIGLATVDPGMIRTAFATSSSQLTHCASADLHGSIEGTASSSGREATLFEVTNVGHVSCAVVGYPALQLVEAHGVTPALTVKRVATIPLGGGIHEGRASSVDLAPGGGGGASFWLGYADSATKGRSAGCQTAFQLYLRIGQAGVQILPRTGIRWCGSFEETSLVSGRSGSLPGVPLATYFGGDRPCLVSQLVARTGPAVPGGLGHQGVTILFRNVSDFACTLHGFPRVVGTFAGGTRSVRATETTGGYLGGWFRERVGKLAPIPRITLRPHGGAVSVMVEDMAGRIPPCPEITTFWSTIPGAYFALHVHEVLPVCRMKSVTVHPFIAGVTGHAS